MNVEFITPEEFKEFKEHIEKGIDAQLSILKARMQEVECALTKVVGQVPVPVMAKPKGRLRA